MKTFTVLLLIATLTPAYPTSTSTSTSTPTTCPTTCPTVTTTIHPGYRCNPSGADPSATLQCPLAKCLEQPPLTTTVTSYLPCPTATTTATTGCTLPQTCVGPATTTTVIGGPEGGFACPTECPELCPRSYTTESRLIGGGCLRTALP